MCVIIFLKESDDILALRVKKKEMGRSFLRSTTKSGLLTLIFRAATLIMCTCTYAQVGGLTMGEDKEQITGEKRVSMNIALSPDDKKFLKVYAAVHDTTVSAVIADCVGKLRKEEYL